MKSLMYRWLTAGAVMLLLSVLWSTTIFAHVTVYPKETSQGTYEKFSVRVPSEQESPTIKVEVKFPAGVNITRFEPKEGWKYEIVKDASGAFTGVIWMTTGNGLAPTEFTEFNMSGKVDDDAGNVSWKAYQTYKDGSVVEWTGAPDSDKPASVTKVHPKAAGSATDGHGNGTSVPAAATDDGADWLPLVLASAAFLISIAALGMAWMRRTK